MLLPLDINLKDSSKSKYTLCKSSQIIEDQITGEYYITQSKKSKTLQ